MGTKVHQHDQLWSLTSSPTNFHHDNAKMKPIKHRELVTNHLSALVSVFMDQYQIQTNHSKQEISDSNINGTLSSV